MRIVKLVLFVAVIGVAYQFWDKNQSQMGQDAAVSANGFVALPTMASADPGRVVVFAPQNCPKEDARRADDMAQELARRNIPAVRTHAVTFTSADPDPRVGARLNTVMNGALPIVFVKGRGKANPTLEEVVSEYGAAR